MTERTLVLVKPDGVQRLLTGRILARFEERGLKLVGLKLVRADRQLAERHYAPHRERPFFRGLVDFMTTDSKFNAHSRDKAKYPFGYFSDREVDRLVAEQSVTPDPERRRELAQAANLITSDKVAAMFVFHPVSPLVTRKEVNYPAESRIPDLVDLDLVTVS